MQNDMRKTKQTVSTSAARCEMGALLSLSNPTSKGQCNEARWHNLCGALSQLPAFRGRAMCCQTAPRVRPALRARTSDRSNRRWRDVCAVAAKNTSERVTWPVLAALAFFGAFEAVSSGAIDHSEWSRTCMVHAVHAQRGPSVPTGRKAQAAAPSRAHHVVVASR